MAAEQCVDRLEQALVALAEAQARTERALAVLTERVDGVEAVLARLAEAQARAEECLDRVEAALARLAEAQAQTESVVQELVRQVGRLSETVGFTLEDLAREVSRRTWPGITASTLKPLSGGSFFWTAVKSRWTSTAWGGGMARPWRSSARCAAAFTVGTSRRPFGKPGHSPRSCPERRWRCSLGS